MGNSNGLKRLRRLIESSNRHSDGLYTQDMFKLKERPDGSYQMFDGTIISAKDMNKPGVREEIISIDIACDLDRQHEQRNSLRGEAYWDGIDTDNISVRILRLPWLGKVILKAHNIESCKVMSIIEEMLHSFNDTKVTSTHVYQFEYLDGIDYNFHILRTDDELGYSACKRVQITYEGAGFKPFWDERVGSE